MIKDAHEGYSPIRPGAFEIARICAILPERFDNNGPYILDCLQYTVCDEGVERTPEGGGLKCLGKASTKYLTLTESETVVTYISQHRKTARRSDVIEFSRTTGSCGVSKLGFQC